MSKGSKLELLLAMGGRYLRGSRETKTAILNEFCALTGMHRKSGIRLLRHPPEKRQKVARQRRKKYGTATTTALGRIWEAAGRPWSCRLKALLPLWLTKVPREFQITQSIHGQLLAMSPRTMDRRLRPKRQQAGRRLFGRTKPGTLLKHQIPIQTETWKTGEPGYVEVDLVSHSGPDAAGEFVFSLNVTDIESAWVETYAVMGKGETGVVSALNKIAAEQPFPLRGVDSDNGSEFINHHLVRYCRKREIRFTRSRPYKKNDNAHIEQKNWTHVRRLLGWDRYDSEESLAALNQLYRGDLRLMMNLFQPCVRLREKKRIGARCKRLYDLPCTPLDRLVRSGKGIRPDLVAKLVALREHINPFELSARIAKQLQNIHETAPLRGSRSQAARPTPSLRPATAPASARHSPPGRTEKRAMEAAAYGKLGPAAAQSRRVLRGADLPTGLDRGRGDPQQSCGSSAPAAHSSHSPGGG